MHPLAREAEFQLRLLLESYFDSARIPPLCDVSINRNEARGEIRFTVWFADGRQLWFACDDVTPMMVPPQWRSTRELVRILAGMWDGMRSERREPPRILAPPADDRPRRGRRPQPDMNVINELMRQRERAEAAAFFSGTQWETTSNVAPPGAAGLTMETMRRAMQQMREASAVPPRYMQEAEGPELRRAWLYGEWDEACGPIPCDCPSCRPDGARAQVTTKSLTLLRQWLSPAQLAQYDKSRYFDVTSSSGKRYQIRHGTQGNVLELDESGTAVVAALCFQPQGEAGGFPGDTMLAQKIMLENDEAAALRAANVNRGFPLPMPVERLATFTLSF